MVFFQPHNRDFTDYRPACSINDSIKAQNQIKDSYQYRLFLQRNATSLMKLNAPNVKLTCDCPKCDQLDQNKTHFH